MSCKSFYLFSTTKKWNALGNTLVGAKYDERFGQLVSMSEDGVTFAAGSYRNDDNRHMSGHARISRFKDIILNKECGSCVNQFGNFQDDGKVRLSK